MALDGNNLTLLKPIWGIGMVSSPCTIPDYYIFLKKAGVFAYAEIRLGGGEKGQKMA